MNESTPAVASSRRARSLSYLVLVLSLAVTGWIAIFVTSANRTKNMDRFSKATIETENTIRDSVQTCIALLRGGAGLFAASDEVTRERFHRYFERLRLEQFYPGIRSIGFAPRVRPGFTNAISEEVRRQGLTNFTIWPSGTRAEYFPITYLEPLDARNERAIGYDMFSEPVRQRAMILAARRGVAVSQKVVLVQESDDKPSAGFLIYLGTYQKAYPGNNEERAEKLFGFIYSPFQAQDFFQGIFDDERELVNLLEVYDGDQVNEDNLLFRSQTLPSGKPFFSATNAFPVAGNTWTLVHRTTPNFETTLERSNVLWILIVGILISGLLSCITLALARAWEQTKQSEEKLLIERKRLQASEELHRTIAETAADAIVTIDDQSKILTVNRAAERIFGYAPAEMVGQSLTMLMPERMRAGHLAGLKNMLTTGTRNIPWSGVELPGLHKDGREIPLEISFGQLDQGGRRMFTGIIRDIHERKKAEREIQQLNHELEQRVASRTEELQEANNQMETFIYSIAHDLRAPLRAMRGFAQALNEDYADKLDQQARDYSNRIMASSKFMDDLINDLLSFSRVTRAEMDLIDTDLSKIVSQVSAQLAPNLGDQTAVIEVSPAMPHVQAHPATLRQVLINLVSNAIKFVPPSVQPTVNIRWEDAGKFWRIWVEDNGIGVSAEHLDKIFGVFEKLNGDRYPGTGIGLAIVRKGVERMGGRVGVESTLDKGSRFWFELPKAGRDG